MEITRLEGSQDFKDDKEVETQIQVAKYINKYK